MKKKIKKEKSSQIYMVRSYAAGVFYGEIEKKTHEKSGLVVKMKNARRVWYWDGAASLSQLASQGTKNPGNCKFPMKVKSVELMNVVEILEVSKEAFEILEKVLVWEK